MDTPTRSWNGRWQATSPRPEAPADLIAGSASLGLAKDNGATEEELVEAITHLAFHAGRPKGYVCHGRRQVGLPRRPE